MGGLGSGRSAPCPQSTEAWPACWFPTSISGRAPNGSRVWSCSTTTSPGSGSRTATTIGVIPGSSSATKGTDGMTAPKTTDDAAATTGVDGVTTPKAMDDTAGPEGPGPWQTATIVAVKAETTTAKSFRLALASPSPHLAGQHYLVRLTAPDGYTATCSYSVASAPDGSAELELTVERLEDGEVWTYLHDVAQVGDELEVRGPVGGWFVWTGETGGHAGRRRFRRRSAHGHAAPGPQEQPCRPCPARRLGPNPRRPVLRRRAARTRDHDRVHQGKRRFCGCGPGRLSVNDPRRAPYPAPPRRVRLPRSSPMPPDRCWWAWAYPSIRSVSNALGRRSNRRSVTRFKKAVGADDPGPTLRFLGDLVPPPAPPLGSDQDP